MPSAAANTSRRHGAGIDIHSMLEDAGIVGLWKYDIRQELVFSDHAMAMAYGVDPALAAQGMPPSAFRAAIHPDDLPDAIDALKTAIAEGVTYQARYRLIHYGGAISVVETHGRPLVRDGETICMTGANFDVTNASGARKLQAVSRAANRDILWRHRLRSARSTGVSGLQIREARRILKWSVTTLSEESGVSCAAISRLERFDGMADAALALDTVEQLKAVFEAQGVEFFLHSEGDGTVKLNR